MNSCRVGKGATLPFTNARRCRRLCPPAVFQSSKASLMPEYRRAKIEGGAFFFTVTLADRSSDILVRYIELLRQVYTSVEKRYPFQSTAICVLPDHLHAIWSLPPDDANFPLRW